MAETKPAASPTAIAAPILKAVPATEPYIIAPEIVPTSEPLIPNLAYGLNSTEKA